MAANALRIAATLGLVLCFQSAASADLVMKFYLDGGDLWMSLSGSGELTAGSSLNSPLQMDNFEGDPFLDIGGTLDLTFNAADADFTITGTDNKTITEVTLLDEGTGQSDVDLAFTPMSAINAGTQYTFSGARRVTNLSLSQLRIGTYNAMGGDSSRFGNVQLVITPEPASLAMMGVGLLGLCAIGLRRRRTLSPPGDAPAPLA